MVLMYIDAKNRKFNEGEIILNTPIWFRCEKSVPKIPFYDLAAHNFYIVDNDYHTFEQVPEKVRIVRQLTSDDFLQVPPGGDKEFEDTWYVYDFANWLKKLSQRHSAGVTFTPGKAKAFEERYAEKWMKTYCSEADTKTPSRTRYTIRYVKSLPTNDMRRQPVVEKDRRANIIAITIDIEDVDVKTIVYYRSYDSRVTPINILDVIKPYSPSMSPSEFKTNVEELKHHKTEQKTSLQIYELLRSYFGIPWKGALLNDYVTHPDSDESSNESSGESSDSQSLLSRAWNGLKSIVQPSPQKLDKQQTYIKEYDLEPSLIALADNLNTFIIDRFSSSVHNTRSSAKLQLNQQLNDIISQIGAESPIKFFDRKFDIGMRLHFIKDDSYDNQEQDGVVTVVISNQTGKVVNVYLFSLDNLKPRAIFKVNKMIPPKFMFHPDMSTQGYVVDRSVAFLTDPPQYSVYFSDGAVLVLTDEQIATIEQKRECVQDYTDNNVGDVGEHIHFLEYGDPLNIIGWHVTEARKRYPHLNFVPAKTRSSREMYYPSQINVCTNYEGVITAYSRG
jgi:hypothetical protein